jgi:hypothetical protein
MNIKGNERRVGRSLDRYQPLHFAFVPTIAWGWWRWEDRWIDMQKQKHINKGKERGVKRAWTFLIVVKLHVMAMHFVCVVSEEQTHSKRFFLSPLSLSQSYKLKEVQHFWYWDDYTTKQTAFKGGREKERRKIMVEKLNYGDPRVLVVISNTKVLGKKTQIGKRGFKRRSATIIISTSLSQIWGRCKVSWDCPMWHHINHLF